MIQKLKIKFVVINMVLVSTVLIGTFIIIGTSTYQNLVKDSLIALQEALSMPDIEKMPKFHIRPPTNNPPDDFKRKPMLNNVVCKVLLGPDNKIIRTEGNIEISQDVLNELVKQCITANKTTGTIPSQNFRYMMKNKDGNNEMAFYDLSPEKAIMYNLLMTFVLVGTVSLAAFFIISLYLARWALKPVEKSWKQQQQFIADASHELKTPLTVILANTDVLASNKDKTIQSQIKWIDYIKTEATRMWELVNNMLFLAKSDAAKDTIAKSSVNFSDLAWGCVLPFESIAYEHQKKLKINISPNISLKGDKDKLKQLIAILLDNAFKYSESNGTIRIDLKQKQDKIHLKVTNTGQTIPPHHLSHLFERFYRADESRARDCGGYGLGLSIAKNIVDMHHGKISVKSSKEEGTVFTVLLQ